MGMTAATKLRAVVENVEHVLAIELMCAAEGLEYRAPLRPGRGVARAHQTVRSHVARLTRDRPLSDDFQQLARAIRRGDFDQ
jgi:Histidine ammonia-lyase